MMRLTSTYLKYQKFLKDGMYVVLSATFVDLNQVIACGQVLGVSLYSVLCVCACVQCLYACNEHSKSLENRNL